MRFHWLLLSCLSIFLCSPAEAGKLLFWRFESNQNRLVFSTDEGVQPRAQLIFNPTRLVIDLPGTVLGRPTVKQSVGGKIQSVRVGQFDNQTTRLVVELQSGYTIDPQEVRFRGISPTQWSVNLPTPEPVEEQILPPEARSSTPQAVNVVSRQSSSSFPDFRVTKNGLFVGLNDNGTNQIDIERSRDRRSIEFNLEGVTLPASLIAQSFPVEDYGISNIEFTQAQASPPVARITMNVSEDSPDWQATFSRLGGLVLFPSGGISAVAGKNPNSTTVRSESDSPITVVAAELVNNSQLRIRAEGAINPEGNWNQDTGVYEVKIPNAELAKSFQGPKLNANSSIFRLRVREEDDNTVVFLVQPASGTRVQGITQLGEEVALELSSAAIASSGTSATPIPIVVPLAERPVAAAPLPQSAPPPQSTPPGSIVSVPQGQILVTIDPGHGGKDPGTIGINGVQEKSVILPISLMVKEYLEKQGVRVQMTRDSDYFVSLQGRAAMANRAGADLFVSIHANAINLSRPDVNGLETYYFQSGQRLAQTIHRSVLQSVSIRDRRVRQARFYVLRKSAMPAVLVETGFLTGREDAANLSNETFRRQMAEAIAKGILVYIQQNSL